MKFNKKLLLASLIFGGMGSSFLLMDEARGKTLTQKINARFANIKLIVNDQVIPTQAEPFIYNGNVYAPVATIANALGINQEWNNGIPAVLFSDKKDPQPEIQPAPDEVLREIGDQVYLSVSKMESTYTLKGKHNGQYFSIPFQQFGPQGYNSLHTPVSSKLINYTGESDQEFLMEYAANKKAEDPVEFIEVILFRVQNGGLIPVDQIRIDKISDQDVYHIAYDDEGKQIIALTYDRNSNRLIRTQVYKWDHVHRKIILTHELSSKNPVLVP